MTMLKEPDIPVFEPGDGGDKNKAGGFKRVGIFAIVLVVIAGGALGLLTFSATVGIIFLLAAYLVTKAVPLVSWLDKARPWIGGVSAVIMIALGILMITYNFHRLTGWMFTLWN